MRPLVILAVAASLSGCIAAARNREARAEVEAAKAACRTQTFTSRVESAKCFNAAEMKFASVYPNPDLLQLRLATRLAISEKIDKGQMTEAEGELEFARVGAQIGSQEQQRSTSAQMADAASQMASPRRTTCTRYGNTVSCF